MYRTLFESNSLLINRLVNQAKLDALIQEQERLIVEEHLEEIQHQKQEQEETNVAQPAAENKDVSCAEDPVDPDEITDQEKEEKPWDVITDDETRVSRSLKHRKKQYLLISFKSYRFLLNVNNSKSI